MKVGWRACCMSMQLDSKGDPRAGCFDLLFCLMQDHTQLSESMFETVVRQLRLQQRDMELVRSSAEQVTLEAPHTTCYRNHLEASDLTVSCVHCRPPAFMGSWLLSSSFWSLLKC